MTVPSLYFLSLTMLVKKNPERFRLNHEQYAPDLDIITRGRNDLRVPIHASSFYENGPYYMAIRAYRLLPDTVRDIESVKRFRKPVINFLKDKCYYSFNFWCMFLTILILYFNCSSVISVLRISHVVCDVAFVVITVLAIKDFK